MFSLIGDVELAWNELKRFGPNKKFTMVTLDIVSGMHYYIQLGYEHYLTNGGVSAWFDDDSPGEENGWFQIERNASQEKIAFRWGLNELGRDDQGNFPSAYLQKYVHFFLLPLVRNL